jgi:hypothetical protein
MVANMQEPPPGGQVKISWMGWDGYSCPIEKEGKGIISERMQRKETLKNPKRFFIILSSFNLWKRI